MGFRAQLNGLCVHYLSASDRVHEEKRSPLFFIILSRVFAFPSWFTYLSLSELDKRIGAGLYSKV